METTFWHVAITIKAESAKKAYAKLCNLLEGEGIEYETDTFTTEEDTENDRDTTELFPDEEEE